jgi:predicted transport protein
MEIAMAKTPQEIKAGMIAGLRDKTGRSMEEWLKLIAASGATGHKQIVKLLKEEHELGHSYANMIALGSLNTDSHTAENPNSLLDAQYSAAKAGLRPLYDKLHAAISKFGKDVEFAPKKAYVSVRRSKQFAIVQPSTATRLDVGINLKNAEATDRLELSGSFNAMLSHRVRITALDEIDRELISWLKKAYEEA